MIHLQQDDIRFVCLPVAQLCPTLGTALFVDVNPQNKEYYLLNSIPDSINIIHKFSSYPFMSHQNPIP